MSVFLRSVTTSDAEFAEARAALTFRLVDSPPDVKDRAAWLEPGMSPYFGSIEYMRAQNWRQFVAALNRWGAPAENQVYADVDGNIGYKPAGLFPRRTTFDGLLPVPGDGRYEWDGFLPIQAKPHVENPEEGYFATANNYLIPPGYPFPDAVGFEWSEAPGVGRNRWAWPPGPAQNETATDDSQSHAR